ncbi:MAG: DUF222 domain-containing protein [Phycicoccus sp.]|nr:DUF222 domain-containing protein [Phycicoccus sp.]NMM32922.1 DUF222 domain-containing protein [Phycicoccus sp.]
MFENTAATDPAGFLAAVTEQLAKLTSELWHTGNDGFAGIAAAVDALAVQLDCARVGLVQEAQSRGVVAESPCVSSTDWLLAHSEHLEPADAARTVDVARLCVLPKNQVMAVAISGGTLTVRKAMTALRQLGQVEHALAPGKREEALASLTLMAQTGYDRHVVAVGRSLMALVGADRSLEDNETALRSLSSLKLCPLANGMVAVSGQLDPESGAVLSAALDPLSAPTPCEANGGRDPRQGDRRRADALVELCRRATAAGGSAPTTTKAQIVVTIGYDRLLGAVRGSGTTLAGQVLSPQAVRKLACDASIIPMVLGSESQPLDVGRTKRLVTPALLAALWARDKGCTFPGCGRPPQWTDAHHVKHWIDGGTTSLLNLALLCGYHHTFVHQRDLTATVTAHDVTWQT